MKSASQTTLLGEIASEVSSRAGKGTSSSFSVYAVTKHSGFVLSSDYFSKQVFSRDLRNYKIVRKGQFAYATIHLDEGSLGLLSQAEGALISPMYTVFEVNPQRVHAPYLYAQMKAARAMAFYGRSGKGSVHRRKAISFERLAKLPLLLPALEEQRRITDTLDRATMICRKRRDAIALTEELLQSSFAELFGDPVQNPHSWPVVPLTDLCESKVYGTAEKANSERNGSPVLRMNNLTYSGDLDLTDLKWVPLPHAELSKLDLRNGDVLFNRVNSHELVGKTAAWHHGEGYTFAGYLIRLRMNPRAVLGDYVSAAMNMPSMKVTLKSIAKPSINMANISGSDLSRILLPVPPLNIQRKYVEIRESVDALRKKYSKAAIEKESLLASLQHAAFGGSTVTAKTMEEFAHDEAE